MIAQHKHEPFYASPSGHGVEEICAGCGAVKLVSRGDEEVWSLPVDDEAALMASRGLRVMFEGAPRTPRKRGSARRAALLALLEEHEGTRGMVMVGAGKDIDPVVALRLVAARLAVRDSGDPGTWLKLTPAGVATARDIRIREMPKGV